MNKMIKVMGAPINETDVPEILDYLAKNYGVERTKKSGGRIRKTNEYNELH
jgi:hypothetical protein